MFKFFTNIKKDKLKRYSDFIYEKLNVDKIDLTKFNSIPKSHWTIYNDLKELSNKLKNEISISFNKVINFKFPFNFTTIPYFINI